MATGVIAEVPTTTIIDLVAEATWVACCADTREDADAFATAANAWVDGHPFELSDCPFEEHVPLKAFFLNFEAGEYDEGWACYVHCSWVLKPRFDTIVDATQEAERYFDTDGVSSMFLEWIVFGDEPYFDELPDGRPLYIYDPELRIFVVNQRDVDEYLVSGGYGKLHVEKVDTRTLMYAAG